MKAILILIFSFVVYSLNAQTVNKIDKLQVNDLVTKKLEVQSTTIGAIPCPVMTNAQMEAIALPFSGSCVFNTNTDTLHVYDGTDWVEVGSGAGAGGGISNWETATLYKVGDVVIESLRIYQCNTEHTSGVFATDIANWTLISGVTLGDATGFLDAVKIGSGTVDNTEFGYLNNVTSSIQTQINGKEPTITTLPMSKGGTNKNMAAVNGGVVYTDADSQEVSAAGTSGQVLQSNGASAPTWTNRYILGSTQASPGTPVNAQNLRFPNATLTDRGSNVYLAETGNKNILANPGFENTSADASWFMTNPGTLAPETTAVVDGAQSLKITLSTPQTLEFYQNATRYASQFADGVQGVASAWVKTTVSGVFVCPRQAGSTQLSNCAAVNTDGKWMKYSVPYVMGGTSNGLAIVSGTMSSGTVTPGSVSGDVYVDDAFVGVDSGNIASVITPWQSYTPTFTGFGTVSSSSFEWRQVGSSIEVRGKFTDGTVSASEARVSLPSSFTISSTIPSPQVVGAVAVSFGSSSSFLVLAEPSVSYLTFGRQNTSEASLTKVTGTGGFASSAAISLFASVPIANLAGSTQIFATNCGANCENRHVARLDIATGAVSGENVDFISGNGGGTSSSRTITFNSGIYTVTPVCDLEYESSPTGFGQMSTNSVSVSTSGITGVVALRMDTGVVLTSGTVLITCDKTGSDYTASRTIVGSFKEVVTAPGISKPKICVIYNAGASSTTACSSSPCTEYYDSCGTASACTRASPGVYTCAFGNGTWAANSYIHCSGSSGTSIGHAAANGLTDANGAFSTLPRSFNATPLATDGYFSVQCTGQAP